MKHLSKIILTFLLFTATLLDAAPRYFINGGVNSNYSTAGNWSATDGGSASGVAPTASDDVYFTSNSPNCTVSSSAVAKTLNFTGYTNTITMTAQITVSGSVTLVAAMTIAGSSKMSIEASGTLTSNGKTWPNELRIYNTSVTLADNWTVGSLALNANIALNGYILYVNGSLTGEQSNPAYICSGTTSIVLNGTGTWSGGQTLGNNLTINTSGTITISGTVTYYGTLTYTSGTVVTTSSTLSLTGTSTLNTSGINWNNLTSFNNTVTLTSNLYVLGTFTYSAAPVFNGYTLYLSGNLTGSHNTSYFLSGTTVLVLNGTTNWTTSGAYITSPIQLNTTGTLTITNAVPLYSDKFLYVKGAITSGSGTWASPVRGFYLQ